jgi:glyoxylase-like metal-dependent hydrolase (beta-lactamase superfamily II)
MNQPRQFKTSGGVTIYQMPVEAHPGWFVNSYLVLDDEPSLIDPGTPLSMAGLESGFKEVGFKLEDVRRCILTHFHFDHFMLAGYVREKSGAPIFAHAADVDFIDHPVEKLAQYHVQFDLIALRAGWTPEFLKEHHEREKEADSQLIRILEGLDFEVDEQVSDQIGGLEVIHTPGHSPGHICLAFDDFIILGDHILAITTPHQMPIEFGEGYGLKKYLDSLAKIRQMAETKKYYGLPGHSEDIPDVAKRAADIEHFHSKRLDNILYLCNKEKSAWEITDEYFARIKELEGKELDIKDQEALALTEIMTHIEYLADQEKLETTERDGIRYYKA